MEVKKKWKKGNVLIANFHGSIVLVVECGVATVAGVMVYFVVNHSAWNIVFPILIKLKAWKKGKALKIYSNLHIKNMVAIYSGKLNKWNKL